MELTPEGVEKYKSNVSPYHRISIDSKGYGVIKGSISETEIDFWLTILYKWESTQK